MHCCGELDRLRFAQAPACTFRAALLAATSPCGNAACCAGRLGRLTVPAGRILSIELKLAILQLSEVKVPTCVVSALQVLDARAGDVYTGGDGGPSPGFEGSSYGNPDAQIEHPRASADGSAAPDVSAYHLERTLVPSELESFTWPLPCHDQVLFLSCCEGARSLHRA